MEYMETLKDLLCAELEDYAEKGKKSGKLSAGDVGLIDTMLHSIKNIMKIDVMEMEKDGYSEDGAWMGDGQMYGMSYEGGSSYARGRGGRGRGRNARRDSMGRYSRDDGMSYARGGQSYARGGRGGDRGGYSREGGYSMDDAKMEMMEQLEDMMHEAEKPAEKEALKRCMQALERA